MLFLQNKFQFIEPFRITVSDPPLQFEYFKQLDKPEFEDRGIKMADGVFRLPFVNTLVNPPGRGWWRLRK